jgi:hypothetical protein
MNGKLLVLISCIILTAVFTGFLVLSVQSQPKKYNLVITKVNGEWKVVDETDYTKTRIRVKKKETIIWTAKDTDAYLQFPDKLFNAVDPEDSLKNGYTKFLKNGKRLKLKVKDDVLAGTYEYAVFCTADGVFASGDSPPKIVIE